MSACLRGVTSYGSIPFTLSAEGGVLRGTATDADGTVPITCEKTMLNADQLPFP